MEFNAFIFDLDGTLLDTLPDLVRLTNKVLSSRGWPERSRDEVLSFVGDGGRVLLERAAPKGVSATELDGAFAQWRDLYPTYGHAFTEPYAGIPEALVRLKEGGMKLGVLSNKFDAAAQEVVADQFPGMFDIVRGECGEIPRKPNPAGLQTLLRELGVNPEACVYVGDSVGDIVVAHKVGAFGVGVAWGYNSVPDLEQAGAQAIAHDPADLLQFAP